MTGKPAGSLALGPLPLDAGPVEAGIPALSLTRGSPNASAFLGFASPGDRLRMPD